MLLAQLNIVSTQQDLSMPQVLDTRADPSPLQEEGPDGGTGDQDSRSRHSSNSNEFVSVEESNSMCVIS